MSIVWTPCFVQGTKDVVQAVVACLCGGRTPGNHMLERSGTDQ